MDTVLKEFPDGSKLTVKNMLVVGGICIVSTAASVAIRMGFEEWSERREANRLKKNSKKISS